MRTLNCIAPTSLSDSERSAICAGRRAASRKVRLGRLPDAYCSVNSLRAASRPVGLRQRLLIFAGVVLWKERNLSSFWRMRTTVGRRPRTPEEGNRGARGRSYGTHVRSQVRCQLKPILVSGTWIKHSGCPPVAHWSLRSGRYALVATLTG